MTGDAGPVQGCSSVREVVTHLMDGPCLGLGVRALDVGRLVSESDSIAMGVEGLLEEPSLTAIAEGMYDGAVGLAV